ncbi:MAG: hypothetical protein JST42_12465 [Bacteroidetes bacterium]|nr:hypothetical protein [Bacteroidota bacterium]
MKTIFYIVLNMKKGTAFEVLGKFFIGNDREFAYQLFSKMEGDDRVRESDILHLDLMETVDGLPVNMKVINCRLEQVAANCRTITKEVFKARNLEEME